MLLLWLLLLLRFRLLGASVDDGSRDLAANEGRENSGGTLLRCCLSSELVRVKPPGFGRSFKAYMYSELDFSTFNIKTD